MRSLIWVFVVRVMIFSILCCPKCAQRLFRSDCLNAQYDLNVRWAHVPEGTTYDFMAHLSAQTGQDRHLPVHNKKKKQRPKDHYVIWYSEASISVRIIIVWSGSSVRWYSLFIITKWFDQLAKWLWLNCEEALADLNLRCPFLTLHRWYCRKLNLGPVLRHDSRKNKGMKHSWKNLTPAVGIEPGPPG